MSKNTGVSVNKVARTIRKHPVATLAVAFGIGYVARNAHLNAYLPAHQKISLLAPSWHEGRGRGSGNYQGSD